LFSASFLLYYVLPDDGSEGQKHTGENNNNNNNNNNNVNWLQVHYVGLLLVSVVEFFHGTILQFAGRDKEKLRFGKVKVKGKGTVIPVFHEASWHDDRVEVYFQFHAFSNLGTGGECSASRIGSFISGERESSPRQR
jgi:hypothetical protein